MNVKNIVRGVVALSPIALLLGIYLIGSIVAGDFYKIPITSAFVAASIYAIIISRKINGLEEKIKNFSRGAANSRVMLMVWIFVLAGAFASLAKSVGAVDSTVALTLCFVPENFLPAGIFVASCFISMAIGTSVGTIVALTPVVTAIAAQVGCEVAWLVAIVVGGSLFGDNLSFISDTTIAATQSQGCSMRDKFKTNFLLVLPAAIITIAIYIFSGNAVSTQTSLSFTLIDCVKIIPYMVVIVTALCGLNVLIVLILGIAISAIIGVCTGAIGVVDIFSSIGTGIASMGELIIVTMLAGGLLEIVKINGGLEFLIRAVTYKVRSQRAAEFSIALLTALSNLCTANNTIAILSTGDIVRDISRTFDIAPRRSASIMDTTSCFVQGVIPYGAQLLMASGLAAVSPVAIIPHLYYPMLIGAMVSLSIICRFPRY